MPVGRTNIVQYGNFVTPEQIKVAGPGDPSPPQILGQWWFDFSRISEANLSLFLGVEMATPTAGTSFFPILGMFLLPDGDVTLSDLFGVLPPVMTIIDPTFTFLNTYNGYNSTVSIPNPGVKRQVLFAYAVSARTTSALIPTIWNWRSMMFDVEGV